MRKIIATVMLLTFPIICSAETIVLKSGKIIEGKIIEDKESYIKIQTSDGNPIYYNKDTISAIKSTDSRTSSETVTPAPTSPTGLIDCSDKGYMLFIPKNIFFVSPRPFLIALPGWGVSAKQDVNMWAFPANKVGFVVVNLDVDYNFINSDADIQRLYNRIINTMNSLSDKYPIDKRRIYVAGTSAGGMMSIALALKYPTTFVAVGVVSGARLSFTAERNLNKAKGLRFYMIHGQKDRSISISEFNATRRQLESKGAIVESEVVPKGEHTLGSVYYKKTIEWLSRIK